MTPSIRRLQSADFDAWLPLWQGFLEFYKSKLPDETSRLTFGRLTGGSEPMGGFIAHAPDRAALGIVHWVAHRSTWTPGDYCYLQDLFVAENRRGAGVGRRLIETVYAEAAKRKCSRVYWLTHETNAQAMVLYDQVADRTGFLQYRKVVG